MIGYDFYNENTYNELGGGYYLEGAPKTKTIEGKGEIRFLDLDDEGNLPNKYGMAASNKSDEEKCQLSVKHLSRYAKKYKLTDNINGGPVAVQLFREEVKNFTDLFNNYLSASKKVEFYNKYIKPAIPEGSNTPDIKLMNVNKSIVIKYIHQALNNYTRSFNRYSIKDSIEEDNRPIRRGKYSDLGVHKRYKGEILDKAQAATNRAAQILGRERPYQSGYASGPKTMTRIRKNAKYKYDTKKKIEAEEAEKRAQEEEKIRQEKLQKTKEKLNKDIQNLKIAIEDPAYKDWDSELKKAYKDSMKKAVEKWKSAKSNYDKDNIEECKNDIKETNEAIKDGKKKYNAFVDSWLKKKKESEEAKKEMERIERKSKEDRDKAVREQKEREAKDRKNNALAVAGIAAAGAGAGALALHSYRNKKKKKSNNSLFANNKKKKKKSWF